MNRNTRILLVILVTIVAAPIALADSVTMDDVIIFGSTCVGLDCSDGEPFDFDTIRIKENNVRIRFFDTSTSASFPKADWELAANATTNGGREYFAILEQSAGTQPFTVEAGAGDDALVVDSDGELGLGTSLPQLDVHVRSDNTPGMRLEQDGSGGFSPQAWDMVGNESNFFIRDATSGTTPFRIRPGAPTGSLEIDGAGDVLLDTWKVSAAAGVDLQIARGDGTVVFDLDNNGDLQINGTLTESSSHTVKHQRQSVDPQQVLDAVTNLDIQRWKYTADAKQAEHMGPMAEDFHAAFGLGTDDKHLATLDTSGVALASIQALHTKNQALEKDNAALTARLAKLEEAVAKLGKRK